VYFASIVGVPWQLLTTNPTDSAAPTKRTLDASDYQRLLGADPFAYRFDGADPRMLESIEDVLLREKPDWVLVYGDTNSTLAGALAACKMHIQVAHVEAGLRSFNRRMPEEINRICTDHVSSALFAPTRTAVCNLRDEGVAQETIIRSGDVMYDATIAFSRAAEDRSRILSDLALTSGQYFLATIHRAENTDDPSRSLQFSPAWLMYPADFPSCSRSIPEPGRRLRDSAGQRQSAFQAVAV
jgi:hypothetical protein